jgi:hypothetical protein
MVLFALIDLKSLMVPKRFPKINAVESKHSTKINVKNKNKNACSVGETNRTDRKLVHRTNTQEK